MSNQNDPQKVTTGTVRLSYAHLTSPHASNLGGEPKYGVTLIIPKNDTATKAAFDRAIAAAVETGRSSVWNGNAPAQPQQPVWDGDGVRRNGDPFPPECHGCWVVTASSKQKPRVVDLNLQDIIEPTAIYSGMYARVSVRFFPYFNSGNKGIGCGLNNVQKLGDGEPLGGMSTPEDDFGTPAPQAPAAAPQSYPQAPAQPYAAPQQPMQPYNPNPAGYAPYAPQPGVPAQPYTPAPGYPSAPAPQQPAINPLTGQPMAPGQILGL